MAPPPLERVETAGGSLLLHATALLPMLAVLTAPPPLESVEMADDLLLLHAMALLPPLAVVMAPLPLERVETASGFCCCERRPRCRRWPR